MYRNVEFLHGVRQNHSVPNLQSPLCKHHILLLWDWEPSHARRSLSHCALGILAEIPYLQLLNLDVQRVLVWLWSHSHDVLADALCHDGAAQARCKDEASEHTGFERHGNADTPEIRKNIPEWLEEKLAKTLRKNIKMLKNDTKFQAQTERANFL